MLLLTPAGTFALRTIWHTGGGKTQLDVTREVLVVPAQTYTANCVAVGRGLTGAVAGEGARFIITAHDLYNNTRTVGGDTFVLSFANGASHGPSSPLRLFPPCASITPRRDRVVSLPPWRLYGAAIQRASPLGPGRALTLPCGWNIEGGPSSRA